LLAEAARSECAPSMRAVKDSLAAPFHERDSPERMASLGIAEGVARKMRAGECYMVTCLEKIHAGIRLRLQP